MVGVPSWLVAGAGPPAPPAGRAQGGRPLATDPDRDARALQWARRQRDSLDGVVLPAVSNRLTRPEPIQYLKPLVEHGGALLRVTRLSEGGELLRHTPEPGSEDRAPSAEEV